MQSNNSLMPSDREMGKKMPKSKDMQKTHDKMMSPPTTKKTHKGKTTK